MDKFLIAPLNSGLQTDQKPFLIPDDAFANLNNAYIFRGRVRKRFGSLLMNGAIPKAQAQLFSKLAIFLGTTDGGGNLAGNVPGTIFKIGQQFSIGTAIYTVFQTGNPAVMLRTVATVTATYDTTTGAYVFVGAPANTAVYFYPSQPVMGIQTYELGDDAVALEIGTTNGAGNLAGTITGYTFAIGQQIYIGNAVYVISALGNPANLYQVNFTTTTATLDTTTGAFVFVGAPVNTTAYFYPYPSLTIAFDTQFAYMFNTASWERLGTVVFTGKDNNFFWGVTARGAAANNKYLYVTNGTAADSIQYWTGTTWTQYRPNLDTVVNQLFGSLLVTYFKDRLIALNTWEGQAANTAIQYTNRIRWSKANDPVTSATSFLVTTSNNSGSFVDVPTTEAITSVNLIKDRLIVFCQSSTWELVFTGNQTFPFRIQQINRELGIESTFSSIVFDKVILGIGNVGIHACNGANVDRIDQKIPYQVFQINNNNSGPTRVAGIRDYYNEQVYWIYPQANRNDTYPSKILIFNYRTGSWATADDSITALGYFQYQNSQAWNTFSQTWQQTTSAWESATYQSQFKSILAGNQEGVLFVLQNGITSNSNNLSITNIDYGVAFNMPQLTIINHNLVTGDYIFLDNIQGTSSFLNGQIFQVDRRVDANTVRISVNNTTLRTYTGGGTVALVSMINIKTKQYSFYAQDMRQSYTSRVMFNVDRTANGQISVDFYVSSGDEEVIADSQGTGALVCTGVLETTPFLPPAPTQSVPAATSSVEDQQQRLWHGVYLQAEGEYIQYLMYFNDAQMRNPLISMMSDFQLNATAFYAQKTVYI
jgi:hypothetical protein